MLRFKNFISQRPKFIIALLFAFIFIIGICCFRDYGIPWDEPNEIDILYSNAMEYSSRLGLLDHNKSLADFFSDTTPLKESEEIDHGEAIYYPALFPMYLLRNCEYIQYKMLHFYYYLYFLGGLFCLYCIVRKLTGRRLYAVITALFLFLSPRMFAESFYNNKDTVLMSLILMCLWFGFQFIDTKQIRYALILGLIGAFTANLRIIGFYIMGLLGMFYLLHLICNHTLNRKNIFSGLGVIVSFFAVFLLITPASWFSIPHYFSYVIKNSLNFVRWSGFVYYRGKIYNTEVNRLPWHYLPVMFGITTPLLIVASSLISPVILIWYLIKKRHAGIFHTNSQYYLLCFVFAAPVVLAVVFSHPIIYNGWRHFYFLYGPLLILVSLVLKTILDSEKKWIKYLSSILILTQFITILVVMFQNHPNEYCYFNILAGPHAEKNYEADYWNVSATQCLRQLIDTVNPDKPITVSVFDWHAEFGLKEAYDYGLPPKYKDRIHITDDYSVESSSADYWMINPTYQILRAKLVENNIYDFEAPADLSNGYQEITSVKAFGNELFKAYAKE